MSVACTSATAGPRNGTSRPTCTPPTTTRIFCWASTPRKPRWARLGSLMAPRYRRSSRRFLRGRRDHGVLRLIVVDEVLEFGMQKIGSELEVLHLLERTI